MTAARHSATALLAAATLAAAILGSLHAPGRREGYEQAATAADDPPGAAWAAAPPPAAAPGWGHDPPGAAWAAAPPPAAAPAWVQDSPGLGVAAPPPAAAPAWVQDSPGLGVAVSPGLPWRLTVSGGNAVESRNQNGSQMYPPEEVRLLLSSGAAEDRGGTLLWRPSSTSDGKAIPGRPGTCVWRPFDRRSLDRGATLRMRLRVSRTDSDAQKDPGYWSVGEGLGLRNPGGTGDFRVNLWQTNDSPNPQTWNGWQVRIFPMFYRAAKQHIGKNDLSNCSHWVRVAPGPAENCMSEDDCKLPDGATKSQGFDKIGKFGMGPEAPFGEWFEFTVTLQADGDRVRSAVRVHEDTAQHDWYRFSRSGLPPFTHVDAISFGFNNTGRGYREVEIACDNF